jgi:cytoskeletal protein CcmA (bactofilin family)
MASQASNLSVIGRAARVHGRVTGAVDLEVQGYVEGDIAVGGDVTVDGGGMVGANVHGRRLVVRGAVKGDLTADESIQLEDGARVVGDVRAPRVAIAPGALVRGFVDTGAAGDLGEVAARPARAAAPVARPATAPATKVVAAAAPAPAPKPAAKPAFASHLAGAPPAPAKDAGPRRPPPPVVPVLKKAKGQIAKKKER